MHVTHQSACDSRNLGGTASLRPFVWMKAFFTWGAAPNPAAGNDKESSLCRTISWFCSIGIQGDDPLGGSLRAKPSRRKRGEKKNEG